MPGQIRLRVPESDDGFLARLRVYSNATHSHYFVGKSMSNLLLPDPASIPVDTFARAAALTAVAPPADKPSSLADLPVGAHAHVVGVRAAGPSREARELALRLLEIGFIEGEPVRVIALGHPGREPIAVRVGGTTFALRRFEAERVQVALDVATARTE
jgi:ferrous iron transport protein A